MSEVNLNNFLAIDFETADSTRSAPCSVGVIKVIDNEIVDALYSFIDPEVETWGYIQQQIHGISKQDVEGKPKFPEIWKEILLMMDGVEYMAGHSVPFEKSVIKACCKKYDLEFPDIVFKCSCRLAKGVYKMAEGGLAKVCERFGFDLSHHNALSDALGTARIIIKLNNDKEIRKNGGYYALSDKENKIIEEAESKEKKIEMSSSSKPSHKPSHKKVLQGAITYRQREFLERGDVDEDVIEGLDKQTASDMISSIVDKRTCPSF